MFMAREDSIYMQYILFLGLLVLHGFEYNLKMLRWLWRILPVFDLFSCFFALLIVSIRLSLFCPSVSQCDYDF